MTIVGVIGFLLFVLGDVNDAYIRKRALKPCFSIGLFLLAIATACRFDTGKLQPVWLADSAVFAFFLFKSLYGSFSNSEAYADKPETREVTSEGLYALCRHPGVLFFCGMYICLHFGIGLPWIDTILYIVLNILLAFFEDRFFFPEFLDGYDQYRENVPFLIPTKESLKKSRRKMDNK